MKNAVSLIACPIFEDELKAVLPSNSEMTLLLMDSIIHNNPKIMKQELTNAIAAVKNKNHDICLMVGCECDCDTGIKQIAKDEGAKHPSGKNCIEIILGPERTKELQNDRTIIFTQGWIKMINKSLEKGRWSEVDVRTDFGYYDRVLVLDYGTESLSDLEILSLYDLIQVPIEIEQVNLDHFKAVVKTLVEEE
jgi:hypothetical protein